MTESDAAKLVFDICRTLILGVYMRHWGLPEYRWISRRELPDELGGASADEVVSFVLDVAVHSYRKDVRCRVGATSPETPLMPAKWPQSVAFR